MENMLASNKKKKGHWIRNVFIVVIVLLLLGILMEIGVNWFVMRRTGNSIWGDYQYAKTVITSSSEADFQKNAVSTFYDTDGNIISETMPDESTIYLPYDEIPQNVVQAFVAIEDRSYWDNSGISLIGILRAIAGYAGIGDGGGGSTITQQLVKLTYLSSEQSLDRKIKEIFMAVEMNRKYTKEQIMEFYCNQVCFGNGIYGIELASETYFGKSASDLSPSQIAYLCAIPNRPTYYNPYNYPERALKRRDRILNAMQEAGDLSTEECQDAIQESLVIKKSEVHVDGYQITYARECAIQYFMQYYHEEHENAEERLNYGGYKIYTSLDSNKQQMIQNAVDTNLASYSAKDVDTGIYELQGAVVAMDNSSGKVIAIVGGRSQIATENAYTLNRAYQSYRQPGSAIKPLIVYTPALMKGYNPEGFRSAVEKSTNSVATNTFEEITPEYGLSFLLSMGFQEIVETDYGLPSALGGLTNGVTSVEMAGAYCTLANHGSYRATDCIQSILTINREEIFHNPESTMVYSEKSADEMVDLMKGVFTKGTAKRLDWYSASDVEVAGKTGTTNDNKDGWLCGISLDYTLVVWVGCDTPQAMSDLEGSSYPGSIWKECMLQLTSGEEIKY